MIVTAKSPTITHFAWGCIEVDGKQFKDAKCFPGGARSWDWRETGTHHVPGIQPADVQELIDNGAEVVVLSQGFWERLRICPETLAMLEKLNIPTYILQTELAVKLYNELSQTKPTGGLFHSTC